MSRSTARNMLLPRRTDARVMVTNPGAVGTNTEIQSAYDPGPSVAAGGPAASIRVLAVINRSGNIQDNGYG